MFSGSYWKELHPDNHTLAACGQQRVELLRHGGRRCNEKVDNNYRDKLAHIGGLTAVVVPLFDFPSCKPSKGRCEDVTDFRDRSQSGSELWCGDCRMVAGNAKEVRSVHRCFVD